MGRKCIPHDDIEQIDRKNGWNKCDAALKALKKAGCSIQRGKDDNLNKERSWDRKDTICFYTYIFK